MKNLLSFEEFVNEHHNTQIVEATDADGMDPKDSTKKSELKPCANVSDLIPGNEYIVDGTSLLYQGVTDEVYIFNGKDETEALTLSAEGIESLVSKNSVVPVAEEVPAKEAVEEAVEETTEEAVEETVSEEGE